VKFNPKLACFTYFLLLSATSITTAAESSYWESRCGVLAGDNREPDFKGTGVDFSEIAAENAVLACEMATKENRSAQNVYRLARAQSKAGKYEKSMKLAMEAADLNYAPAQALAYFNLGVMYDGGFGVVEDEVEAVSWYRKAAEQGHVQAQYELAVKYHSGNGVTEDSVEAASWYRKAAEQGYAQAQYIFGLMSASGIGVAEDYAQAVFWYRKAAEQGHAQAQYQFGVMLYTGSGVAVDDVQAVSWYRKAAEQGHAQAQYALGVIFEYGFGAAEDDVQAVSWYRKAAEQGHTRAQHHLGVMYDSGLGVVEDDVQAVSWYRKAAEQGECFRSEQPWCDVSQRRRCRQGRCAGGVVVSEGRRARRCFCPVQSGCNVSQWPRRPAKYARSDKVLHTFFQAKFYKGQIWRFSK
jgi:TPR repeat protein